MKITTYLFAALMALSGLSCSQGHDSARENGRSRMNDTTPLRSWGMIQNEIDRENVTLRRLESITWDSVNHQLTWDVSKGEKKGNSYQPNASDRYEIKMDTATMTVNGESRRFSDEEAQNVRTLMDFISRYALESTVWWENGEGEPVDGNGNPKPGKQQQQPQERNLYRNNGELKGKDVHVISFTFNEASQ